jgi:hypothetical protein
VGHIRLGPLPKTRDWEDVVELLNARAPLREIARSSAYAARRGLSRAESDPGLGEVFFLLTQLPRVARIGGALDVGGHSLAPARYANPVDFVSEFSAAVDATISQRKWRSDLSEIAQMSAIETLLESLGRDHPQLFAPPEGDVARLMASYDTRNRFGDLSRMFFAKFVERYLSYYLSRELAVHVGADLRFHTVADHTAFYSALQRHCYETARIVEQYAGEWRSKKQFEQSLTRSAAQQFVRHALKKMNAELVRREAKHAH